MAAGGLEVVEEVVGVVVDAEGGLVALEVGLGGTGGMGRSSMAGGGM